MKLNVNILAGSILVIAGLRIAMAPYPNVEPIMLFTLTAAIAAGPLTGFLVGAGSMFFSDMFLGLFATAYTTVSYGLVGAIAGLIGYRKKKWNRAELTALAFALTLFYDLVTAGCWALQTMRPLPVVYADQVPFTLLHLTNCVFVFLFAPWILKAMDKVRNFSPAAFLRLQA